MFEHFSWAIISPAEKERRDWKSGLTLVLSLFLLCNACLLVSGMKLRPGSHDIGSLFMPDRFHESDNRTFSRVCVFTQRVLPNSGAERIGFIWSRVNKTPIRYETESDTLVIR